MNPLLDLQELTKTYAGPEGPVRALARFSLTLQPGEFVSVQGASGCGKTSLLLAAGGLLQPDSGRVVVEGVDLYALSAAARARVRATKLGFVFQQFHLIPYLSVLDNVLCPALAATLPEASVQARRLLDRFGLNHRLQHVPAQLSTGERQRAALARALLHSPRLLLADEPTGNLDAENGAAVLAHLESYAKSGGAVLLVTHDPRVAEYASRTVRMPAHDHELPQQGSLQ